MTEPNATHESDGDPDRPDESSEGSAKQGKDPVKPVSHGTGPASIRLADVARIERESGASKPKKKKRRRRSWVPKRPAQTATSPAPARSAPEKSTPAPAASAADRPPEKKAPAPGASAPRPAAPSTPQASGPPPNSRSLKLTANLREHAQKMRSTVLAQRHREVQVVQMSTVARLVEDAVAEAVEIHEREWSEKERERLKEESEEIFNERIAAFKAENAGAKEQAKHLQDQLERAQSLLEEERNKVVEADQFMISDAGLLELDKRMSRLIDKAVARGGASSELAEELRSVVSKLLDDEREKISQKAREAQSEMISLLERKVGRLASSLEDTQKARDAAERRAHILEASAGNLALRNTMDAGLDDDDPNKERKLALLKEIVSGNRDVREFMGSRAKKVSTEEGKESAAAAIEAAPVEGDDEHDSDHEDETRLVETV